MVEFQVIVLWLAVYLVGYSRCSLELPHPKCEYGSTGLEGLFGTDTLGCGEADLDIPYFFSVNLIPSNVTSIVLHCPNASRQNQCNVLRGDLQPLPYRSELFLISLWGFRTDNAQQAGPNQARIPVPQFLDNVKHRIKLLEIKYSKIAFLDGEFVHGFQSLEALWLDGNDIRAIDVESFQFLMDPLVPVPNTALQLPIPKLSSVYLSNNHLQDLDWAVFRPVARTISDLDISSQQPGLSSLRRTGQPFSMNFTTLSLFQNNISEIPAAVLDTIAFARDGSMNAMNNNFCSNLPSGDCSCCQMVDLIKWIERNSRRSVNRPRSVYFSCGSGSTGWLSQDSKFPLAMFTKCPEADTILTFPHRSCYTPQHLRMECSLGRFQLSSSNRMTSDASTIIFSSDGRRQCNNVLYELHSKALEMAGITTAPKTGSDAVQITCQNGTLRVNEHDPDAIAATKIVFQADSSIICHDHLHEFADFIYALPQNSPGTSGSSPVLPIDVWLSDFLICSAAEPLVVNCTRGVLASSEKNLTQSPAIALLLYADNSLDCRMVLTSMHDHILKQEMVQIDSYAYAEREDAVVAVVQHGVTVISENQPNKSTKRNLKFYSAPNRLSRNKFQKLTDFLHSFFGNGTV